MLVFPGFIHIYLFHNYVGRGKAYEPENNISYKVAGNVCLCWGFTVQSTRLGHVERGQFI